MRCQPRCSLPGAAGAAISRPPGVGEQVEHREAQAAPAGEGHQPAADRHEGGVEPEATATERSHGDNTPGINIAKTMEHMVLNLGVNGGLRGVHGCLKIPKNMKHGGFDDGLMVVEWDSTDVEWV